LPVSGSSARLYWAATTSSRGTAAGSAATSIRPHSASPNRSRSCCTNRATPPDGTVAAASTSAPKLYL
jgi:hypothetical protein